MRHNRRSFFLLREEHKGGGKGRESESRFCLVREAVIRLVYVQFVFLQKLAIASEGDATTTTVYFDWQMLVQTAREMVS